MRRDQNTWQQFVDRLPAGGYLRPVIQASWRRSEAAGVDRRHFALHRVSDNEQLERQSGASGMLAVAKRHLDSISEVLSDVSHAACVADRDGIVLYSCGDLLQQEQLGRTPGHDWSERTMGTNGAGTALTCGAPVAVIGPEHYIEAFAGFTSTAAPIHGADGKVVGAIDICTSVADGNPERLTLVAYAARMIDRELALTYEARQSAMYRTMTERLRVREMQLEQANAELLAVLDNTPAFVYVVDTQNNFVRINPRGREILGLREENAIGRPVHDFLPADIAEQFCANNRQVLASGTAGEFEETLPQGGGRRTFLSVKVPVYDVAGKPWAVCGVATDITERKAAEEEVRRHARQLQRLAEVALKVHSTHDLNAVLQTVTDAARELIGAHMAVTGFSTDQKSPQLVLARSLSEEYAAWRDRGIEPDDSRIYALMVQSNRTLRLTPAELAAHPAWREAGMAADGTPPLRGLLAAPLPARNGGNLGYIQLSARYEGDFTDADEAVLVQLAQLASIAIENAWLYRKLNESNARKDRFLTVLAEEVRNPLVPMRNAAFVLGKTVGNATVNWAANIVKRQIDRLSRLANDLLDISRIENGRIQVERAPVKVGAVVEQAVEMNRALFKAKEQELVVDLPPQDVWLYVDKARVAQALSNLLANAATYSKPGRKVWLSVRTHGQDAVLRVKDEGAGLRPEQLQTIFEPFVQIGSARLPQGGPGLGLWLVKNIAELHGGAVSARSEGLKRGSEFEIRLPLLGAGASPAATGKPADARVRPAARRILVVDHHADAADSFGVLLETLGQEVRVVYDGERALEIVPAWKPDIVFLDIMLDRSDIAARLKKRSRGKIAVVALVGDGSKEGQDPRIAARFDRCLMKPVDPDRLEEMLAAEPVKKPAR